MNKRLEQRERPPSVYTHVDGLELYMCLQRPCIAMEEDPEWAEDTELEPDLVRRSSCLTCWAAAQNARRRTQ